MAMINRFLHWGVRFSSGVERRLAQTLINQAGYYYTTDWVTRESDIWTKYLRPWQGVEQVQMLEIGSFEGRSALWFLQNILTAPTAAITCLDLFRNRSKEIIFEHNLQVAGLAHKVIKIKGKSQDVLKVLRRNYYDLIYIDGGHRACEVHTDAVRSWPLLKAGGVIIFDDYLWQKHKPPADRPQQGIDQFVQELASELVLLHQAYQVIVQKK